MWNKIVKWLPWVLLGIVFLTGLVNWVAIPLASRFVKSQVTVTSDEGQTTTTVAADSTTTTALVNELKNLSNQVATLSEQVAASAQATQSGTTAFEAFRQQALQDAQQRNTAPANPVPVTRQPAADPAPQPAPAPADATIQQQLVGINNKLEGLEEGNAKVLAGLVEASTQLRDELVKKIDELKSTAQQ